MKKVFAVISFVVLCFFAVACGNEKAVGEFKVDFEQLESDGYVELGDIAYGKIECRNEKPVAYIVYYKNMPELAFYLMNSIMEEFDYKCDFVITWRDQEYKFDDSLEERFTEENYLDAFPEEWRETIKEVQSVGIDNIVTKANADVIEETAQRFVKAYKKEEEKNTELTKEQEKSEPITEEETQSEVNVIYSQNFLVDGQELKLSITEADGKVKINAVGYANTEEKASLMLAILKSTFDDLSKDGYSILINCGELNVMYLTTDNGFMAMGTNRDGTTAIKMPDWVVSELTMAEEEANAYAAEVLSALKAFGEEAK